MSKEFLKRLAPEWAKNILRNRQQQRIKKEVSNLPKLDQKKLESILINELGIEKGDTLLVHSSVDHLNLSFPFFGMIPLIKNILGEEGTFLMPAYPKLTSYKFLISGEIFDVKRTPSYTGALNEFLRRQPKSIRSLHPTKSVAGLGKNAAEIVSSHHLSPYPYDMTSPYYKVSEFDGKFVGIGLDTTFLSAVHCADDILKEKFPVFPYHNEIFEARCIDHKDNEIIVKTYAHNMKKMDFKLPEFFDKYLSKDICRDINVSGMKFFVADAPSFIDRMVQLAEEEQITIYKKKYYK